MQRVFVLSSLKQPLMPCSPARGRHLLKKKLACVFRANPFTILLLERNEGGCQHVELNVDPGSKTTGIALVADCKRGRKLFFAANLSHRGEQVKQALEGRRAIRRSRRNRKTRYRAPRFSNRTRLEGWLPPSLLSRVGNTVNLARKLKSLCPIKAVAVETVRFDTQKMVNPELSGVDYQQGTLHGYEVREYLLEKWRRQCAYCHAQNLPLEVEHIAPRAKGGSNRISNLTLACRDCNQKKGSQSIYSFLEKKPELLRKILSQTQASLKDTASVNATRYKIGDELKSLSLPVSFWSGGRTKYNRCQQQYHKDHWIDAACVGERGCQVIIPPKTLPLLIKACGRGSRQMCRVDRFGFPRTKSKTNKIVKGFQTGDLVTAIVLKGKKQGFYRGRVAVRASGNFNITTIDGTVQGIHARHCRLVQRTDGYYYTGGGASSSC